MSKDSEPRRTNEPKNGRDRRGKETEWDGDDQETRVELGRSDAGGSWKSVSKRDPYPPAEL